MRRSPQMSVTGVGLADVHGASNGSARCRSRSDKEQAPIRVLTQHECAGWAAEAHWIAGLQREQERGARPTGRTRFKEQIDDGTDPMVATQSIRARHRKRQARFRHLERHELAGLKADFRRVDQLEPDAAHVMREGVDWPTCAVNVSIGITTGSCTCDAPTDRIVTCT